MRRAATAPRHQVHGAAERVWPEERAGAAQQLDPFDLIHGQEVEIDLRRVGLVLAHAIEEDRQAGREAHGWPDAEAARREVELVGRAEIVVDRNAGASGQDVRRQPRLPCVDCPTAEHRETSRKAGADGRVGSRGDRMDLDRLDGYCGVAREPVRLLTGHAGRHQSDRKEDRTRSPGGRRHASPPPRSVTSHSPALPRPVSRLTHATVFSMPSSRAVTAMQR